MPLLIWKIMRPARCMFRKVYQNLPSMLQLDAKITEKYLSHPRKASKQKTRSEKPKMINKLSACFRSVSRDTPCRILKDKSNDLLTKNARITGFQDIQEYK